MQQKSVMGPATDMPWRIHPETGLLGNILTTVLPIITLYPVKSIPTLPMVTMTIMTVAPIRIPPPPLTKKNMMTRTWQILLIHRKQWYYGPTTAVPREDSDASAESLQGKYVALFENISIAEAKAKAKESDDSPVEEYTLSLKHSMITTLSKCSSAKEKAKALGNQKEDAPPEKDQAGKETQKDQMDSL